MAAVASHSLLHHIRRLPGPSGADGLTDRQLLERFAAGEEEAFVALMRRHGSLVWGVCRRELGHEQDAEDVFQATFLVLARKAGAGCWGASVGGWLFETAYRLACETKRKARRLAARQREARNPTPTSPVSEAARRELASALDEEMARLPENYRAALLLCVLGGMAREEAARQLGCSLWSVKHHLERGRELLRRRLGRRGWSLGTALLVGWLGSAQAATPPRSLLTRTREAVTSPPPAGSEAARALAEGALGAGGFLRGRLVLALGLVLGVATAGTLFSGVGAQPDPGSAKEEAARDGKGDKPDLEDPLPVNALRRFGTTRFRHPTGIQALALSPDGKTLATAGGSEGFATIRLMDPATGRVQHLIREVVSDSSYRHAQQFLSFAPDGKTLACGGQDGIARLYETAGGKLVGKLPAIKGSVQSVAFAPDGKTLATCGNDQTVRLWDLKGLTEIWNRKTAGGYVLFSPDARAVAVLSPDNTTTITFLETGTAKEIRSFSHGADIGRAAFSADGTRFLTGGSGKVIVWDAVTGKEVRALDHPRPEEKAGWGYAPTALALSPDGKTLATGGSDKLVRLWDLATGKQTHTLEGHEWWVVDLAFSPDGATLYSGSWDSTVRRWDVKAGKELPGPEGYSHSARIACSADGSRMAISGGGSREVQVRDKAGKRLATVTLPDNPLSVLAMTADGQRLATGHRDGRVDLWDVGTGRRIRTLRESDREGKREDVRGLAFSPDGKALAAAGPKDSAYVWYFDRKPSYQSRTHPNATVVAWSPDGKTLATSGWDHKIRLWDEEGNRLAEIDTGDIVDSLAFSPDGRLFATSHHDQPIRLWDVRTHKEIRRLTGHHEVVWSVAFSPDGLWLASAGLDQTVRLWDVALGKEVLRREGHAGWVIQAAFGQGGRTLLTASLDTTAILWTLRPDGKPMGKAEPARLWEELAGDAEAAYRAVWALAEDPRASLPILEKQLTPARATITPERLKGLLEDLDGEDFEVRESATRELKELAPRIEPTLRRALEETKSAEVKRRVRALLAGVADHEAPERVRQRRAMAALERMGTPKARDLLHTLAGGSADEPLTRDARQALDRLGRASR